MSHSQDRLSVVVHLDNGLIERVVANAPADVILCDADTEGGDEENIVELPDGRAYVTLRSLSSGGDGHAESCVDAGYVAGIARAIPGTRQIPTLATGSSGARHSVTLRVVIDVRFDTTDCEAPKALRAEVENNITAAIGRGVLAGASDAVVDQHDVRVFELDSAAADLDQSTVANWLGGLLESGSMRLEDVPELLARYALDDPVAMREEFAERMGRNG